VGAERFALCLLDIANHIQSQGATDIPRYARVYLYGGPLALRDKERFFELLRKTTGVEEPPDPPWPTDVIELLGRMIRNPLGATDVLRHFTAGYNHCVHLQQNKIPPLSPSIPNISAVALMKDVALTFSKAAGINRRLFAALDPL
jgi:hypothetical protein